MQLSFSDNDDPLAAEFRRFVMKPAFPCLGAKSALTKRQLHVVVASDICAAADDARVYQALIEFAARYRAAKTLFWSFVIIFRGPTTLNERAFEEHLWVRLQSLTDRDTAFGQPPDARVSTDPSSPHFALSFGGEAFFAVGLHPGASRAARRFSHPAIVLNAHEQFEELRRQDLYGRLRERILARDLVHSGSINPMLREFGETSEAVQYSGRIVGDQWKCPFDREPT